MMEKTSGEMTTLPRGSFPVVFVILILLMRGTDPSRAQRLWAWGALAGVLLLGVFPQGMAWARGTSPGVEGTLPAHAPHEILVRLKPQLTTLAAETTVLQALRGSRPVQRFRSVKNLLLLELPPTFSIEQAIKALSTDPNVLYVEPNYLVVPTVPPSPSPELIPNDPQFGALWNLDNTGQTGGTPDADIDAPEAWDLSTGDPNWVVAVLDTGVDYTHPDLAANMWRNEPECAGSVGVDDDGNGFVDDCHGIDTFDDDADPMDLSGHGTHVTGILGAVGQNALGVVGVAFRVQIMACRFLGPEGGTIADAIACLDYVLLMKQRGVNVIATNNSWGGGGFSQALKDAIAAQMNAGLLFVAAAGNAGSNNDFFPFYPASFFLPNLLAVAATDDRDAMAGFSQFGAHSVHLGAPGVNIWSTLPGGDWAALSGTSMATPHVTGLAVLLKAQDPSRDWRALKNLILTGGDLLPTLDRTISGRRLNAQGSLTCNGRTLFRVLRPVQTELALPVGSSLTLQALNVRCAQPAGPVSVQLRPAGTTIFLHDDGQDPDLVPGDGMYAGTITIADPAPFDLVFPDGTVLRINRSGNLYRARVEALQWRTIAGHRLGFFDDDMRTLLLPFDVRFGGNGFAQMTVSSNGALSFAPFPPISYGNTALPNGAYTSLVAPFWDDLIFLDADSDVLWDILGQAPHRELVIEWRNAEHFPACPGTITFQAVFFEGGSDVLFNYQDVGFGSYCEPFDRGGSATVGIQVSPGAATTYSMDAPLLTDGLSLRWTLIGQTRCDVQLDDDRDLFDLIEIAEFLIGQRELGKAQQTNADADGDGQVDLTDIKTCADFLVGTLGGLSAPWSMTRTSGARPALPLRLARPVLALQVGPAGALRFDPQAFRVRELRPAPGVVLLAQHVDNRRGLIRFVLLQLNGPATQAPLTLAVEPAQESHTVLTLQVDQALDELGRAMTMPVVRIPFELRPKLEVEAVIMRMGSDGLTITVPGRGIQELSLEVFDLAGRSVFAAVAEPTTLRWPLRDRAGRRVANDVYLVSLSVRGTRGERLQLSPRKVVVLR